MFTEPEINLQHLHLEHGMKVIDIGSGVGHYCFALAKIVGPSGHVYGLDVQKDLLAKLKSEAEHHHFHNIDVIWGNAEKINGTGLKENFIDRVIVSNVLFQMEHRDTFCEELKRILKKHSLVLVIEWKDSFKSMGPHPSHVFSEKKARELFEKHGFDIEKQFYAGDHHYGLILRKV